MHRTFRKLLVDAVGVSEFVIAINLDIRGFSAFSREVESPDAAMFIKRVYVKLIDEYFNKASFFKPTGDGLLIIIPYTEGNLESVVRDTIDTCVKVLGDFGSFCANDPMINFAIPKKVGIGLARGTACRLVSNKKTLDYSGRVLNLASRLMDNARPEGIVFDADLGIELLSDGQIKKFLKDSVYIKGIAESTPIDVFYTKNMTVIPAISKQPIEKIKWKIIKEHTTSKVVKDRAPSYLYDLPSEPLEPKNIKLKVSHPCIIRGRNRPELSYEHNFTEFEYFREAGGYRLRVDYDSLARYLESYGARDNWKIEIEISYAEG